MMEIEGMILALVTVAVIVAFWGLVVAALIKYVFGGRG